MTIVSIDQKLRHLCRYFDFSVSELEEVKRFYKGEIESIGSKGVRKLFDISAQLCREWNRFFLSPKKSLNDFLRRNYLLRRLFPCCPGGLIVRRGLSLVIGKVTVERGVFINVNAKFSPWADVHLGARVQIGPSLTVALKTFGTVEIQHDAWIGSGVDFFGSSTIGAGSVIGSGAIVFNDVEKETLAFGRPCKPYRKIVRGETFSAFDSTFLNGKETMALLEQMKKRKITTPKALFQRVLLGKPFSTTNIALLRLYQRTHALCRRLDEPGLSKRERERIIDELFPLRGGAISIGKNFFMDLIGTVVPGKDVTIGDNVCLGGLIRIQDGATIGDGTVLFASNHPLDYRKRRFGFHAGLGLSVPVAYASAQVETQIHVGRRCSVSPKTIVDQDMDDGSFCISNGTVLPFLTAKENIDG